MAGLQETLYVGTFNTPELYTLGLSYDAGSDKWLLRVSRTSDAVGSHSFLALSHNQETLYATAWTTPPSICAYRVPRDPGNSLTLLNALPTASRSGYVACSDRAVYSAGGASGETFSIDSAAGGSLGKTLQTLRFVEASARQEDDGTVLDFGGLRHGAHSIDLSHDGGEAYVADIGRNAVFTFSVDHRGTGALTNRRKVSAPKKGDGPRHCTAHPSLPYLYVVQEHASRVDTYRRTKTGPGEVDLQLVAMREQLPLATESATDYWSDEVRLGPARSSCGEGGDARQDAPAFLYASTRGLRPKTRGWLTIWRLVEGVPQEDPIVRYRTRTSGGWANAVEPAPFTMQDGREVLALTCSEEGLVMILTFDGTVVEEVACLSLGNTEEGEVKGAATAVWRKR